MVQTSAGIANLIGEEVRVGAGEQRGVGAGEQGGVGAGEQGNVGGWTPNNQPPSLPTSPQRS
jgi:hypothetical protein